jgi:hypothetical protein
MFHQDYDLKECAWADIPTLIGIADQLMSHPQEFWNDVERRRVAEWCRGMAKRQQRALKKAEGLES